MNIPCSKQSYDSKQAAKAAMRRFMSAPRFNRRKGWGRPSVYHCAHCRLWHWGHNGHRG